MFIINPYRYAATGPQPITDFFGSIHTSSIYYNLGPIWPDIIASSIHTSSFLIVTGAIFLPLQEIAFNNYVDLRLGVPGQFFTQSQFNNYVELVLS